MKAINETAKLFWVFPFNAFDVNSYRKISKIVTGFSILVFFVPMYFSIAYLIPWIFDNESFPKTLVLSTVTTLLPFILLFLISRSLNYSLSKVKADHLLEEFDLNKGSLKILAKEDIEKYGYFSAKGYWTLYCRNIFYNKNRAEVEVRNAKKKLIKANYPSVFSDETD